VTRTIYINGGDFGKPFIRKVIALTKKTSPRICFLPTAGADSPYAINWWYELCQDLPMKAYVQRVFLNSSPEQKTFEENLLGMDAIVVGGGSTLNMMAIWKAQGIDTVLKKAYQKGMPVTIMPACYSKTKNTSSLLPPARWIISIMCP